MKYIWRMLIRRCNWTNNKYEVNIVASRHEDAIERAYVWARKHHRLSRKELDIVVLERLEMKVFV